MDSVAQEGDEAYSLKLTITSSVNSLPEKMVVVNGVVCVIKDSDGENSMLKSY